MPLKPMEKVAFSLSLLVVVSGVLSMGIELAAGYVPPAGVFAMATIAIVWFVSPIDGTREPSIVRVVADHERATALPSTVPDRTSCPRAGGQVGRSTIPRHLTAEPVVDRPVR
jgi:hypothetical protein